LKKGINLKDVPKILFLLTKITALIIKGTDEKELKRLALSLIKEILLYIIKDKLMKEFTKRNLQVEYKEEIAAWFVYLDQQKFGKKLEKQMMAEIKRFITARKTIYELIEEIFNKPEWEESFIEDIPANYVFKSALGYA